jgi:hypothetical protein
VIVEAPVLPDVPDDATERLCAQNVNAGSRPDAHTLTPNWDGTRLNLGWAIDMLHPRVIGH